MCALLIAVVHEMMAIIISIRNAIRGTNEKYEPLVEEKEEKKEVHWPRDPNTSPPVGPMTALLAVPRTPPRPFRSLLCCMVLH